MQDERADEDHAEQHQRADDDGLVDRIVGPLHDAEVAAQPARPQQAGIVVPVGIEQPADIAWLAANDELIADGQLSFEVDIEEKTGQTDGREMGQHLHSRVDERTILWPCRDEPGSTTISATCRRPSLVPSSRKVPRPWPVSAVIATTGAVSIEVLRAKTLWTDLPSWPRRF